MGGEDVGEGVGDSFVGVVECFVDGGGFGVGVGEFLGEFVELVEVAVDEFVEEGVACFFGGPGVPVGGEVDGGGVLVWGDGDVGPAVFVAGCWVDGDVPVCEVEGVGECGEVVVEPCGDFVFCGFWCRGFLWFAGFGFGGHVGDFIGWGVYGEGRLGCIGGVCGVWWWG